MAYVGETPLAMAELEASRRSVQRLQDRSSQPVSVSRRQLLSALINNEWQRQAARKYGIEASRADMNDERIRTRVFRKLTSAAVAGQKFKATDAEIRRVYRANRSYYSDPAQRVVSIVQAGSRGDALTAFHALADGQDWAAVRKRYAVPGTRDASELIVLSDGQVEEPLNGAVFRARVGKLTGPVHMAGAWFVFVVREKVAARPSSLHRNYRGIADRVVRDEQEAAVAAFLKRMQAAYRARTECVGEIRVPECGKQS